MVVLDCECTHTHVLTPTCVKYISVSIASTESHLIDLFFKKGLKITFCFLATGHVNLLYIMSILVYVLPKRTTLMNGLFSFLHMTCNSTFLIFNECQCLSIIILLFWHSFWLIALTDGVRKPIGQFSFSHVEEKSLRCLTGRIVIMWSEFSI